MALTEAIGYTAAFLTTVCTIPQLVKAIRTKQTKDVSFWYFLTLTTGVVLWLTYGILLQNGPMIAANGISFFLIGSVLVLKIKYG